MVDSPYEPALVSLIEAAIDDLCVSARRRAPVLGREIEAWIGRLSPTGRPVEAFTQPWMFPMFLLPWWLERSVAGAPEVAFQTEVVASTLHGYCHIRLLDNVMDRHAPEEIGLLPALALFHLGFEQPYRRLFGPRDGFWERFERIWLESSEAVTREAASTDIDLRLFDEVASKKLSAAKIPLAAVCHHHDRLDRLPEWLDFCDRLGRCHQMLDDLFDWHQDLAQGRPSYFLSEARRCAEGGESIAAWVVRSGFDRWTSLLESWLAELRHEAKALASDDLDRYLAGVASLLDTRARALRPALHSLVTLAEALGPDDRESG